MPSPLTPRRRGAARAALLALALSATRAAGACTVTVAPPAFGAYDPFDPLPSDAWGEIAVQCPAPAAYEIALGPGAGTIDARRLHAGTDALAYNLYIDATRTLIWGDGSGVSQTVSGLAQDAVHPLYGRIAAGQMVPAGTYADAITVTVTY